jgi:hypothetical protein
LPRETPFFDLVPLHVIRCGGFGFLLPLIDAIRWCGADLTREFT